MSFKDVRLELEPSRAKAPESIQHSNDEQLSAAMFAGAQATAPASDAALRSADAALSKARQPRSRTLVEVHSRQIASDPRRDPSFTAALARNGAVFNLRGKV